MSDEADLAAAVEAAERGFLLAAHAGRPQGTGRPDCEDCGAPIPEGRRAAHGAATRCLGCQLEEEAAARRDAGLRAASARAKRMG